MARDTVKVSCCTREEGSFRGIGSIIYALGKASNVIPMAQPTSAPSLGASPRAADVMSSQMARSTKANGGQA